MSEETAKTAKIRLKKGFPAVVETTGENGKVKKTRPKRMEFSKAGKTISLGVKEVIEVPLKDLQLWLNTGKIEQVLGDTPEILDEVENTDDDQNEGGNN